RNRASARGPAPRARARARAARARQAREPAARPTGGPAAMARRAAPDARAAHRRPRRKQAPPGSPCSARPRSSGAVAEAIDRDPEPRDRGAMRLRIAPLLLAFLLAACSGSETSSTTATTTGGSAGTGGSGGSGGALIVPDPVINEPTTHTTPF